jgi:hypothetical protein
MALSADAVRATRCPPKSGPMLSESAILSEYRVETRGLEQPPTNRFVNYLDARQRCGPFLNEGIELVQIDRFYQMMLKTCLAAFADVLFHPETGKSDSERRFRGELLYQVDSIPIG